MPTPLEQALLAKSSPLNTSVLSDAAKQAVAQQPLVPSQPSDQTQSGGGMRTALTAMGIGDGLDAFSTIRGLGKGLREGDPIYGSHPSIGRVLATKAADAGLGYLLDKKLYPTHPKLAEAIALMSGAGDTAAALHNFALMKGKK